MELTNFMKQFAFNPDNAFKVGIERECFLTDLKGNISPIAPEAVKYLGDEKRFGYELSACQLEERVGPCFIHEAKDLLEKNEACMKRMERVIGCKRLHTPVAPASMPLDVYPDPKGRYQRIVKVLPTEVLLAACRVTAVHVHIGLPDHATALRVYNRAIQLFDNLLQGGIESERFKLYTVMAPDYIPRGYKSWEDFHKEAIEKKFEEDPRSCWHLIRISVHGTIEFRMFDTTKDNAQVVTIAERCLGICKEAIDT